MDNEIKRRELDPFSIVSDKANDAATIKSKELSEKEGYEDLEGVDPNEQEKKEPKKEEDSTSSGEKGDEKKKPEEPAKESIDRKSVDKDEEEGETKTDKKTPEDEDVEVEIKGNPFYYIADYWKREGKLPEDYEVKEDVTDDDLQKVLYDRLANEARQKIRDEEIQRIKEDEGIDDYTLQKAKKLAHNVSEEEVEDEEVYQFLSSVELKPSLENFEDIAKEYLTQYYSDLNLKPHLIERNVEADLESMELNDTLKEAKNHFATKYEQTKTANEQKVQQALEQRKQEVRNKERKMRELISSRKIANSKYTPEQMEFVEKALFERDQVVKNAEGKPVRVSYYQKKRMEAQNDFEKSFANIVNFILQGEDQFQSEEVEPVEKAKREIIQDASKMVGFKVNKRNSGSKEKPDIERRKIG